MLELFEAHRAGQAGNALDLHRRRDGLHHLVEVVAVDLDEAALRHRLGGGAEVGHDAHHHRQFALGAGAAGLHVIADLDPGRTRRPHAGATGDAVLPTACRPAQAERRAVPRHPRSGTAPTAVRPAAHAPDPGENAPNYCSTSAARRSRSTLRRHTSPARRRTARHAAAADGPASGHPGCARTGSARSARTARVRRRRACRSCRATPAACRYPLAARPASPAAAGSDRSASAAGAAATAAAALSA
ncbi:conserved hypothetical protein [Ricinus communis]|uniref:Uncharacterized protein n=1 Tax=Ricinus communis TaxID=3988 RepID=B9TM40_RICCO|nr:conserved hypothetical protein [Ricinus communis]